MYDHVDEFQLDQRRKALGHLPRRLIHGRARGVVFHILHRLAEQHGDLLAVCLRAGKRRLGGVREGEVERVVLVKIQSVYRRERIDHRVERDHHADDECRDGNARRTVGTQSVTDVFQKLLHALLRYSYRRRSKTRTVR